MTPGRPPLQLEPAPTRANRPDAPAKAGPPFKMYLVGCALFALLFMALLGVGVFFGLEKAKDYGYDAELAEKSPSLAGFLIGLKNTGFAEDIKVDHDAGVITFKDSRTGKKIRVREVNGILKREIVGTNVETDIDDDDDFMPLDGPAVQPPRPPPEPPERPKKENADNKF